MVPTNDVPRRLHFLCTPIVRRCVGQRPPYRRALVANSVLHQATRIAIGTALCPPPTARFTDLGTSVHFRSSFNSGLMPDISPCRFCAKLRHTNTYSIPSSARASTVGRMVRKRLPGLPTTVILFEPSVGLPTSADGPHPRREGFDDGRLRTMGHRDEIKPVAGQSERMRLHELSAP